MVGYLLFAFLSFLLTSLALCLLAHSCQSLSLLFLKRFVSIMTLDIAVCQKLNEQELSKKRNRDRTLCRSAFSAAVSGRHHFLQREHNKVSTIFTLKYSQVISRKIFLVYVQWRKRLERKWLSVKFSLLRPQLVVMTQGGGSANSWILIDTKKARRTLKPTSNFK